MLVRLTNVTSEENVYSIKHERGTLFNYNFLFSIFLTRVQKSIRVGTDFVGVWIGNATVQKRYKNYILNLSIGIAQKSEIALWSSVCLINKNSNQRLTGLKLYNSKMFDQRKYLCKQPITYVYDFKIYSDMYYITLCIVLGKYTNNLL